jgi:hypothetical protein
VGADGGGVVNEPTVPYLLDLIRDLIDEGVCWFDHHGGCQEHGYLSLEPGQKCPHAEAKEVLAAFDEKPPSDAD